MTRRNATLVWAALLVVPLAFMAATSRLPRRDLYPRVADLAFWLALGASALNVVLSRILPERLERARPHDGDAVAFARLVVAFALCEAAAIAPLVAWIVSRDPRLRGVLAVDLLALVVLFPSEGRWDSLRPAALPEAAREGVR